MTVYIRKDIMVKNRMVQPMFLLIKDPSKPRPFPGTQPVSGRFIWFTIITLKRIETANKPLTILMLV
jgi:hypothetical protein